MRKTLGIIGALILIVIGNRMFGVIGTLIGAAAASFCLKYFGVVSPNSAWVTETEWLKKTKYILLGIVLIGLAYFAYIVFSQ